jgi:hypothetical protein
MQITLELTPTQEGLLKALAPRGAAKTADSLERTALRILADGMTREARMRRITLDQVGAVALVEAAERRRER